MAANIRDRRLLSPRDGRRPLATTTESGDRLTLFPCTQPPAPRMVVATVGLDGGPRHTDGAAADAGTGIGTKRLGRLGGTNTVGRVR